MLSRVTSSLLAACALLGVTEGIALACGPNAPPPPTPACTTLRLHAPGKSFPVDLAAHAIRVTVWNQVNDSRAPIDNGFPLSPALQVMRGGEPVAFTLEQEPGIVPNGRVLKLADPQPGDYTVAWAGDTCRAQASPPAEPLGFTLGPSAALPAAAGTLAATSLPQHGADFQEGVGGDCKPIMVHVEEAEAELTLAPAAELAPWRDAITTALEIDGNLAVGFSTPGSGPIAVRVARICSSDTPRYLENPGVGEGKHVAKMHVRIEGLADVTSTEAEFTIHCEPGAQTTPPGAAAREPNRGVDDGSEPSPGNGCATSGGRSGSSSAATFGLGLVAAMLVRRRRR